MALCWMSMYFPSIGMARNTGTSTMQITRNSVMAWPRGGMGSMHIARQSTRLRGGWRTVQKALPAEQGFKGQFPFRVAGIGQFGFPIGAEKIAVLVALCEMQL